MRTDRLALWTAAVAGAFFLVSLPLPVLAEPPRRGFLFVAAGWLAIPSAFDPQIPVLEFLARLGWLANPLGYAAWGFLAYRRALAAAACGCLGFALAAGFVASQPSPPVGAFVWAASLGTVAVGGLFDPVRRVLIRSSTPVEVGPEAAWRGRAGPIRRNRDGGRR